MSHEWHRGVLDRSSWHGLEEVGVMVDASAMISHGERSGAWPTALRFAGVQTVDGLTAPGRAIVASYVAHPDAALAIVGGRYNATTPDSWRKLIRAATAAGAQPTGAFSLRDGTRMLATFQVGTANGLRTQMVIADAFDGTMRLTCGTTSIRVVCANTLSMALRADGSGMSQLRHTSSLESQVNILAESIGDAIQEGEKVRDAYKRAERMHLTKRDQDRVISLLYPYPDKSDKVDPATKTKIDNQRREALGASMLPANMAGPTLASLWNGATWLVDRTSTGEARPTRGNDPLDSMLFGSRGERVEEIKNIIQVVMRDGSIQEVEGTEAIRMGLPIESVGRTTLESMLSS